MELAYLKTANSMGMWISCIPAVVLVLFQAFIFMLAGNAGNAV